MVTKHLERSCGLIRSIGVTSISESLTIQMNIVQSDLYGRQLAEAVLNTSINGVIACEAVRNAKGQIIDLEILLINKAFTEILGLTESQVIGKRYLSVFPSSKGNGMFDINCQVIETGKSDNLEYFYKDTGLEGWYRVSLSKFGENGLLATFIDVSEYEETSFSLSIKRPY